MRPSAHPPVAVELLTNAALRLRPLRLQYNMRISKGLQRQRWDHLHRMQSMKSDEARATSYIRAWCMFMSLADDVPVPWDLILFPVDFHGDRMRWTRLSR